jgi:hypothetical protein
MINKDPWAPWNDPAEKDDPWKLWNDPWYAVDPFAPWNDPFADNTDYEKYCDEQHIPKRLR